MQVEQLTQSLRAAVKTAGFQLVGCCPAVSPPHYQQFCQWLDQGMAGSMDYLPKRREAYSHPRHVLDGAKSVVMLGMSYFSQDRNAPATTQGNVARYAWGEMDYHDLIHRKLKSLLQDLKQLSPDVNARGVVDTAPLLERDFARLAGLGWVGKNTMLINKRMGSYFLLAAIIVDCELEYDSAHQANHCGTCTRCLDACPTDAFYEPGKLDANRCISYLTIEQKGAIDPSLRSGVGQWWFGCDVCQEVCPWNRHSVPTAEESFFPLPGHNALDLLPLFSLNDDQFRARFRKTPMWRSRRSGALRNAAIVLGNQKSNVAVPVLVSALGQEEDPVVRGAAAWALGQIADEACERHLAAASCLEVDQSVISEIENARARIAADNAGP